MENTNKQKDGFTLSQWEESDAMAYDRSEVYQKEIRALVDQLHDLCKQHKIPMHFIACFGQEADGSNHCHQVTNLVSTEELPGEILARVFPKESLGPEAFKRVLGVVVADQARINRFYENNRSTH